MPAALWVVLTPEPLGVEHHVLGKGENPVDVQLVNAVLRELDFRDYLFVADAIHLATVGVRVDCLLIDKSLDQALLSLLELDQNLEARPRALQLSRPVPQALSPTSKALALPARGKPSENW